MSINHRQSIRNRPRGYKAAAAWVANDPDGETFLFRKFGVLAARNLLYMQAELLALEAEIQELDTSMELSRDIETDDILRTWEALQEQAEAGGALAKKQVELMANLQDKIKTYREHTLDIISILLCRLNSHLCGLWLIYSYQWVTDEALLLQAQIVRLNKVDKRVLDVSRIWFNGGQILQDGSKPDPVFGGQAKNFLDDENDLVALKAPVDVDPLSKFLRRHWVEAPVEVSEPILVVFCVF